MSPARMSPVSQVIRLQETRIMSDKEIEEEFLMKVDVINLNNSLMHVFISALGLLAVSIGMVIKPQLKIMCFCAMSAPALLLCRSIYDLFTLRITSCLSIVLTTIFDLVNKGLFIAELYFLSQLTEGLEIKYLLYYCIIGHILVYLVYVLGLKRLRNTSIV